MTAKGVALVVASATGFGVMPYFAIAAYGAGLDAPTLLLARFSLAALALFGYLAVTGRLQRFSPRLLLAGALLGGIGYAGQSAMYFTSVQYVSPSLTALLLYLYPVLVALLAAAIARRRPSSGVMVALFLSVTGTALAIGPGGLAGGSGGGAGTSGTAIGVALGVGAALTYSVYIVAGERLGEGIPHLELSAYVCLFAAVTFAARALTTGTFPARLPPQAWIPVALVAVVSTVLAVACFFAGMAVVGATRASIISTFEPVVTLSVGVGLYGATFSPLQLAGAALVLIGAALGVRSSPEAGSAVAEAAVGRRDMSTTSGS